MSVHGELKASGQPIKAAAGQMAKHVTRFTAFQQDIAFFLPNPSDHIQKTIRSTKKFFEQQILADLGVRLPENPLIVDFGAGIGNSTLFFAKVTGAKVLAFEPNAEDYAVLEASIKLNAIEDQIDLHQTFGEGENASLDAVLGADAVDLIRIDAVGYECEVLSGASAVLARCKPMVAVRAATLEELKGVEEKLRPYGYRKTQSYNETPIFLFEYGIEPKDDTETYTSNLLATLDDQLPKTTGIYAGMSTVAGNEAALRATVMSLVPQVDGLFLTLSGYTEVPDFLVGVDRVMCRLSSDSTQNDDAEKLWGLGRIKDVVFLTCDDTFVYPADYVHRMTQELANSGGKCVVCAEGALLVQPVEDLAAKGACSVFQAEAELIRRRQVHVPHVGACAFHSSVLDDAVTDNQSGTWLTKLIHERQLAVFTIPHKAGWLCQFNSTAPGRASSSSNDGRFFCANQTEVLQSITPLSIADGDSAPSVACLSLEKDSNVLTALKDLPVKERNPVVLILCDAVTEDLRAKIAQSSYNWEIHLLARKAPVPSVVQGLAQRGISDVTFWRVEKRRVVRDADVGDLAKWLEVTRVPST